MKEYIMEYSTLDGSSGVIEVTGETDWDAFSKALDYLKEISILNVSAIQVAAFR